MTLEEIYDSQYLYSSNRVFINTSNNRLAENKQYNAKDSNKNQLDTIFSSKTDIQIR